MITCVLESGDQTALRHATVDALLVEGESVLLARRGHGISQAGRWALPGGYVDRDESVLDAVRREVLEETHIAIAAQSVVLFAVMSDPARDVMQRQNVSLVFLAQDWEGVPHPGPEVSEIAFFNHGDLPEADRMAADHRGIVDRYFAWLTARVPLPLVM